MSEVETCLCDRCKVTTVTRRWDAETSMWVANGDIYEAPPWMPEGTASTAICYECENKDISDGEDRRQEDQIDAALRSGRADLA